jgi:hypothetical protein
VIKPGKGAEPTINDWVEWASRSQPAGKWYSMLSANWKVPVPPLAFYAGNQVYFTFPGFQSSTPFIIQPVIQFGVSAAGGTPQTWTMASWHCNSQISCIHSSLKAILPGHDIVGAVWSQNCSGGNCTWSISSYDATTNVQTVLNVVDTENYWWGVGGSVEVYNLTSCDQFPINGVRYTTVSLYDQNGVKVSPGWTHSIQSNLSPQCGFGLSSTVSSVNLNHNPARVTASGGLSASCGITCSNAWIGSISASGNQITVRDNGGHTGIITLTGFTASGGLGASCGITCSNAWIVSITASGGNTITVRDNGGHTGIITLTGARASGGLVASCGTLCSNSRMTSVTANGSNGLRLGGNGNKGYMRFD